MRSLAPLVARCTRALAGVALLALASPADVWIVDAAGGGDFFDLPAAVAFAQDGDTLIVRDGSYNAFSVTSKGLRIAAQREAYPQVSGSIIIQGLAKGGEFVLSGLSVVAPYTGDPALIHALTVYDSQGSVRIQDCYLEGARNANSNQVIVHDGDGGSGVVLVQALDVMLVRCTLQGGRGHEIYDCCGPGGGGGESLFSAGSLLAVFDCTLIGGTGGYSGWGGLGGAGANLKDFGIFATGSTFQGGKGGYGDDFIFGPGGKGGDGLRLQPQAQAQLRDNQLVGGAGGGSFLGQLGAPGVGLLAMPGSVVTQLAGAARRFTAAYSAWEGGSLAVQVEGEPGDRVWFPGAQNPGFRFAPSVSGVWALMLPVKMLSAPQGILPASGALELLVPLTALPAGEAADLRHYQGYVISTSGKPFVGTPLSLVRLACDLSEDCDGSGVPDACEIQSGAVSDCNHNGVPDACDIQSGLLPDCNLNGVADACDIATGASIDCNADGIPDECQYDCNGNGIADVCDVLSGFSSDCDGNLVPDECDADCNANGLPDACDIAAGTSFDANGNGVPDECQSPASTYLVDAAGPPYGNDGSAAKPFDTLRKAIDYAIGGNTLVVRNGTYTGPDNRALEIAGYDLAIVSQSGPAGCVIECQDQERAFLFAPGTTLAARLEGLTIRNGNAVGSASEPGRGGGVLVQAGAAATLVDCVIEFCNGGSFGGGVFVSPEADAVLEGCTLRANQALSAFPQGSGGGGLSSFGFQSTGTLVLRDCMIRDNQGYRGGGLMLGSASSWVEGCDVRSNEGGTFGGGIWHLGPGAATVVGCRILNNSGSGAATGFYSEGSGSVHISHCSVLGNVGNSFGAGVGVRNLSSPSMHATIEHCLIAGNVAGSRGAGVLAMGIPEVRVRDCTIVGNTASDGGGAYVGQVAQASFENCVLWGNQAGFQAPSIMVESTPLSVDFCDVEGGLASTVASGGGSFLWGTGNFDSDPLFLDLDGPDNSLATWGDNNMRLGAGSPCVDAGDNTAVSPDVLDLDGDLDFLEPVPLDLDFLPRFVDDPNVPDTGLGSAPLIDLGAYERP